MSRPRRPRRAVHGVLLLDKPLGRSSNDALLEVRHLYAADKAGHTGTLDPLATGLLPICLGQATRLTAQLLDARKRYLAEVRFGERRSTGDLEGQITAISDPRQIDPGRIEASLHGFVGRIHQVPPMYSAVKQGGQRLYLLAREGVEVERVPREVEIHSLRLHSYADGLAVLDVVCSKGTYIRTLAEDWAASLGQCAHLQGLRRIGVGPFGAQGMISLEDLRIEAGKGSAALDQCLLPPRAAVAGWREIEVDQLQARELDLGRAIRCLDGDPGEVVILSGERLLGLGEILADGRLQPRRWFGCTGI